VRALTGSDIPTNAGCFRPVTLHRPEGTLVSPIEPAPVGCRTATIKRIVTCIFGALKDVLPNQVPSDGAGVLLNIAFGGKRPDTNDPFVATEILVGGTGASGRADGIDVIETDITNCMNTPVEAMEMDAPVRVLRLSLRQDSGGPGQFRGGLGLIKEYQFLGDEVTLTHRGERHLSAPKGSCGGGDGAKEISQIFRATGEVEYVPSKIVTQLRRGDRLLVQTPGGGGYGDPKSRAQTRLQEDVEGEKISLDAARTFYGWTPP
jgi:N-methylhydantoinase B